MAKPETIVVSTAAVLLVAAISLLAIGTFGHYPALRQVGFWIFISAVVVSFLPLILLVVVLTYERLKGRKKR